MLESDKIAIALDEIRARIKDLDAEGEGIVDPDYYAGYWDGVQAALGVIEQYRDEVANVR